MPRAPRRLPAVLAVPVVSAVLALAALAVGLPVTAPAAASPAAAAPPGPAAPPGHLPGQDGPVGGDLLGGTGTIAPRGGPALPGGVGASAWVVADLDSGDVLAARNPHGRYLPASTLKTLTALTLLPRLTDRKRIVTGTADDANIDGTRVGIVPGGRYTVEMLFQCMLMMSGNDCANALARAAGGLPVTLGLMNTEARRLHAADTHAATPSGLDGPGQSSSAYDLALILREAVKLPDFVRYNTTRRSVVPAQPPKYGAFEFSNDNQLLANYPGTIAAKNGYTNAARHTYVSAARRGDRRLVVTLMHGERHPVDMWEQARALLDWGFALPRSVPPVGELVAPGPDRTETSSTSVAKQPPPTAQDGDPPVSTSGTGTQWWPAVLGGVALFSVAAGTALTLRRKRPRPNADRPY